MQAKQTWAGSNIEEYKIQYVIGQPKCVYDLSVISGRSIKASVTQKRCTSINDVEDMFNSIERTLRQYQCHQSGCRCGRTIVEVQYQPEYGFPLHISRKMGPGIVSEWDKDGEYECNAIFYGYVPTQVTNFKIIRSAD